MSNPARSPFLTDLYQLTMLQAYFNEGSDATAVFEFFVRKLPAQRNFLVAAGLDTALDFLENLKFDREELAWLEQRGNFSPAFLAWLAQFRFTGSVHAMPEGRIFFANEPVLRITAPIFQAQLVESRIVNILQQQILVASKAARCVLSAPDRVLVDFGMRRAHGAEAAMGTARSSYIAGFAGTATVLAGMRWEIPIFGTMAHSFVQAHESEMEAFRAFALAQPDNVVLLIDTYDTLRAARMVVALSTELAELGIRIKGVRIDSGDLAGLSRKVRVILDHGGCQDIKILLSGNLDEYRLRDILDAGAPVDGFGIGTSLAVSADAPSLDCVYKLQEYAGLARRKKSSGKETWPGRKQVRREFDNNGTLLHDTLCLEHESVAGEALLFPVMDNGQRVESEPLSVIRERGASELARLPSALAALDKAEPGYSVLISPGLVDLARAVDRRFS